MSALAPSAQKSVWLGDRDIVGSLSEQVAVQVADTNGLPPAEQCQRHFLTNYLPQDILQKIDRASMYNSLEVRSPFLSSQVVEYALTLPYSALFSGYAGKRLLRRVAGSYLSEETISRKKHGFPLPVSILIKGDLRDIVESTLINKSNPMYEYINFESVDAFWSQHMSGRRNFGKPIWALFMLAAFFRNLF
jgi:asparagine synthase (glutamine-hydrolysing)